VTNPSFLTFIIMIPIDCKITNFTSIGFFLFFITSAYCFNRKISMAFTQLLITRKCIKPVCFVFTHFQLIALRYKKTTAQKHFCNHLANIESTECSIIRVCTLVINLKVGVLLDHSVRLCIISSYFEHFG